jgi:hypothetical protein
MINLGTTHNTKVVPTAGHKTNASLVAMAVEDVTKKKIVLPKDLLPVFHNPRASFQTKHPQVVPAEVYINSWDKVLFPSPSLRLRSLLGPLLRTVCSTGTTIEVLCVMILGL